MSDTPCLIRSIKIDNLLSFGPDSPPLELKPLNVLIGPNGSGKSNLLEVIGLLRAAPRELTSPFRSRGGGGIQEWLWKGKGSKSTATVSVFVDFPQPSKIVKSLGHTFSFNASDQGFKLVDEQLVGNDDKVVVKDEKIAVTNHGNESIEKFLYTFSAGKPTLLANGSIKQTIPAKEVSYTQSILSLRKDSMQYPEITYLGQQYERIKLYREWQTGINSELRRPQVTDLPNDFLLEDASNLAMVLHDLNQHPNRTIRKTLIKELAQFQEGVDNLQFSLKGGTLQIILEEYLEHEEGHARLIPASRLSDGTLRYLCLLAILCHPAPPPLICIEEPEVGLHPDIIPSVADLLNKASQRTQLIVTTHSDILIDALTETPENVVVCEKKNGSTNMRRLEQEQLEVWLKKKYRLGKIWLDGHLGGNRW